MARTIRRPLTAVLVLVALATASAACGDGDDASAGAPPTEAVRLEPVGSPPSNPFTESVSPDETAELPDAVEAATNATLAEATSDPRTGGVTIAAATAGLYGGTRDDESCDVGQLTSYLVDPANTDKAAAFASVLGISTGAIAETLASFAPVVLTVDTLVTNHGFSDGRATPFPAVLQAGTAVLVDATGAPRVKCGCGNPLTRPPTDADLDAATGDAWDRFSPTTVVTVAPSTVALDRLTLVDLTTGDAFERPFTPDTAATTTTTTTTAPPATEPAPTTASVPPTTTTTAPTTPSGDVGPVPILDEDGESGAGCDPPDSGLGDGWWFGFNESPVVRGSSFQFDLACFYYGRAAGRAAHDDDPVNHPDPSFIENDVYVRNSSTGLREVPVAASADLRCIDVSTGLNAYADQPPCDDPGAPEEFLSGGSWSIWIRVEGGQVTKVVEQFAP